VLRFITELGKEAVEAKHGGVIEFESLEEAYSAMKAQTIDAVVADLPILQDQMKEKGFILVGGTLTRQAYAFVLPKIKGNDELLARIDREIIGLQESGEYDKLYEKYLKN
jgi:putative glutamine transport system substrate-binding protein